MSSLSHSWNGAGHEAGRCDGFDWRGCLRRLLVVGDEAGRRAIADHFASHGCAVLQAGADDALRRISGTGPLGLVILAIEAPTPAHLSLLGAIRARSCVPVILTVADGSADGRVASLEAGADDVLQSPFALEELVARARAILRRQALGRLAPARSLERGFRFGGWELRQRARTLRDPKGASVALTKTEYALLAAFLRSPRRALSRLHLILATRAHEDLADRSIDVQVLRLRQKLEKNPSAPRWIRTVRGFGYSFDAVVEILT